MVKKKVHKSDLLITSQQQHEGHEEEEASQEQHMCESTTSEGEGGRSLSKLPTDIIHDILLRLPIETLSPCRAVSKLWYQTIKHPRFIKAFNTKVIQNNNSPFVIPYIEEDFHFDKLDPNEETVLSFYTPTTKHISQIYSCNGWFLFITKPKEPYFICNLVTGEHMVIPKSPIDAHGVITGFGQDPVSKVFKIIRISDDCTHKLYFGTYLEVYNSGTLDWSVKKWGGIDNREPCRASYICRFKLRPNTVFNGILHWIAYPYRGSVIIVSFKLETEEFQQVAMPPDLDLDPIGSRPQFHFVGIGIPSDRRRFQHYLVVLGECLSLVHNVNAEHVEIWMMKDYWMESSWSKQYIIKNIMMDHPDPVKGPYNPIKMMKNGEILLLCSEQTLGYYDPVRKGFRPIHSTNVFHRPSDSQQPLNVGSLIYLTRKQ